MTFVNSAGSPAGLSVNYAPPTAQPNFRKMEGLDGLRLAAVLIVLVRHLEIHNKVPGGFGVSVFFFISGFLISRLLLAEEEEMGRLNLSAFYVRRFIRLLPPLFLMGVISIPTLYIIFPEKFDWLQVIFAFFYLGNFYRILSTFLDLGAGLKAFEPLWSLAIEEHFYLILPLALIMIRDIRTRIAVVFIVGCMSPLLLRAYIAMTFETSVADLINYRFTFTRLDAMAWGVLATLCLHSGHLKAEFISRHSHFLILGGCAMCLLSMLHWTDFYEVALKYSPQTVAIGCVVIGIVFAPNYGWLRAILEWSPISFLGRASYEIYLWHLPIYMVVGFYFDHHWVAVLLTLSLTLAISSFAYLATSHVTHELRQSYGSRLQNAKAR